MRSAHQESTPDGGRYYDVHITGGSDSSRFALRVSGGGTQQQIEVPGGSYRLGVFARGDGGQVVVTDASGNEHTLDAPSSGNWNEHELTGIDLPGGAVTVSVQSSGTFDVDDLSLVQQSG